MRGLIAQRAIDARGVFFWGGLSGFRVWAACLGGLFGEGMDVALSKLPTVAEMIAHLDKFVRGQEQAKRDLCVAVYKHYLSQAHRQRFGSDLGRFHILLLGPSGSGKTYMVKKLVEFLQVPVGFSSAAGLVEAGYVGNSVELITRGLLDRADGNVRLAERGIVFLDEIDKIKRGDGSGRDVSGEGVQNGLLTLLDGRRSSGTDSQQHSAVDTSRVLFICAGAFVGLQPIIEHRLRGKSTMGFRGQHHQPETPRGERPVYELLRHVQTEDLLQFGMIHEFVARFATVSPLHEMTRDDMRKILEGSVDASAWERQRRIGLIHGVDLELTEEAIDEIVDRAMEMKTGARALSRIVSKVTGCVDHCFDKLAEDGIMKVVMDRDCVTGRGKPKLVAGKSIRPRIDHALRAEVLRPLPSSKTNTANIGTIPNAMLSHSKKRDAGSHGLTGSGISGSEISDNEIKAHFEAMRAGPLGFYNASVETRAWWQEFEQENQPQLVFQVAEELFKRDATIEELYKAYKQAKSTRVTAVLHLMDYLRFVEEDRERCRSFTDQDPDNLPF